MTIAPEKFTYELFVELLPLAQKCWRECTDSKGENCAFYGEREFDIEPHYEQYQRMANEGVLSFVAMREEARLVGYVIGFAYVCLHHKHVIGGIGDNIYVEPAYRERTGELVDKFVSELRALKAEIIGWPVIPGGYVHKVLKSRGFVRDDVVMEKRLCVLQQQ